MSQESVIQFFEAISQDKTLQGQLNYGFATAAPEALIQIAQENGYSFAVEDLKAVLDKEGELSDEQLNTVSGGQKPSFVREAGPPWVQNQPYDSRMEESLEKEAVSSSSDSSLSAVETFGSLMD